MWHCRLLATGQEYAIKRIDKAHLKRHQKEQTALAEKNTLVRLGSGHPGIVRLHWTFQDEWSLCESYQPRSLITSAFDPLFSARSIVSVPRGPVFVLDLARNGELQTRISKMGSLSIECVRYYAAQIVDALGYMHSKGVIHRYVPPLRIPRFPLTLANFPLPQGSQTRELTAG